MKIKELRKFLEPLFAAECTEVFERCYTVREMARVAEAFQIASEPIAKLVHEKAVLEARWAEKFEQLKTRIDRLEKTEQFTVVRPGGEPQEEVFLIDIVRNFTGPLPFPNKITLIKAVREVSNMFLKDANDLVMRVADGSRESVFKGPVSRAAVAARVLVSAGGVVERKEAI